MTIPVVLTKIKKKIEASTHLDQKSKLIVLHIIKQVFKEIPKEELIYSETSKHASVEEDIKAFGDIFPWLKGDK